MSKKLPASPKLQLAEFINSHWVHKVEPGYTLDDLTRPNFWAHHYQRFTPGDEIDVIATDFSLDVKLRVTHVEVGLVKMYPLTVTRDEYKPKEAGAEPDLPDLPEGYKVVFAPKSGWLVRTLDPSATVSTHKEKLDAYNAAVSHAKRAEGVPA